MTTRKGPRGFTLFELIVVMLVGGALTLIALPTLSKSQQIYRLSAATTTIQSRLNYARIQAISQNTDCRIRVVNSSSYVLERWVSGSWQVAQTYNMASDVSVSASGTAEFHPRGNANAAATFTVTRQNVGTRQIAVAASGYIHAL